LKGNAIEINDFGIAYIDENYVRYGELEISKLFRIQSVLEEIKGRMLVVEQKISQFKNVINLKSSPLVSMGLQCYSPYECDFLRHCWKTVPSGSVFQLKGLPEEKKFELFNKGIKLAADLPESELLDNDFIGLQVKSIAENRLLADHSKLQAFRVKVKSPVAFLSILWDQPALPVFDGMSPYGFLPFSIAIQNQDGHNICKLAQAGSALTSDTIMQVLSSLDNKGSILVFNAEAQLRILKNYADKDPEFANIFGSISQRIVDLKIPYSDYSIVWPQMMQNKSPEAILLSMGKQISTIKTIPSTALGASLIFMKLFESGDANPESELNKISNYHLAAIGNIKKLWDTLNEIYKIAENQEG
jgi:hypothetical protein